MRTHFSRTFLAAIAAFSLVGAVLTPALVASESATATAPSYTAPFDGVADNGSPWLDLSLENEMVVGVSYFASLWRAPYYDFYTVSGELPPGLTFTDPDNPNVKATITGVPTQAGNYSFDITAGSTAGFNDDKNTAHFNVTVLPVPQTTVAAGIHPADLIGNTISSVEPGQNFLYEVTVTNTGAHDAFNPSIELTLPAGVTYTGVGITADWTCVYAATLLCTSTSTLESGFLNGLSVQVTLDPSITAAVVTGSIKADADNAPATSPSAFTTRVYFAATQFSAPSYAAYNSIALTASAPFADHDGHVTFEVYVGDTWTELGSSTVSPVTGAATYNASVSTALIGSDALFRAVWYVADDSFSSESASSSVYIYKQLTFGGSFYLNGQLYADPVDLYFRAGTGGFSYAGDRRDENAISGGTYSLTSPSSYGYLGAPFFLNYNYLTQNYYLWATLPGLGNASTTYNTANVPNAPSDLASQMNSSNYTNDMNFYWELAPSFSDETMAVPRKGAVFTDGVSATSNVDITYSKHSGNLPTGLSLDPATGAITGTATTVDESYNFTIDATISFDADPTAGVDPTVLTATSAAISGVVLSDVPVWTDKALGDFRAGEPYSDGVEADGSPTITYSWIGAPLEGISLDTSTGALTGTPLTAGEPYIFAIRVSNSHGYTEQVFEGTVLDAYTAPVFTDDSVGEYRVGVWSGNGIAASGVPAPTFSITAGAVPDGIYFGSDGVIVGTPTTEGPYSFEVTADNGHGTAVHTFVGTVLPAWVAPHWTDDSLKFDPQVGVAVTDGVEADGDGTIAYKIKGGTLPDWLTLDTATGALTGTPTADDEGEYFCFKVRAKSEHGSTYVWISGTVGAAPEVILDPDFVVGDTAAGATGSYEITGGGDDEDYDVTVHSTPIKIVAGTTSSSGPTSGTFTLPSGLGEGAHSLVLTAHAADGTPRTFTIWFTIKADGTIGAISYAGPITYLQLVTSGTDAWIPGALALGLLALGGILLVRRRKAA